MRQLRQRGEAGRAALDNRMTSALSQITTQSTSSALPGGQLKPFPSNCMSLMTVTGAKGSNVNFNQIAALLGQQELEGKRVPRMSSGKTLPSFPPFSSSARSGGFIRDRFITGLRPQEYFFHCMAGREGLVDTTVKTSRSGYLQRCLVKNLEGLRVAYDYTVRDSDDTICQFRYGEDALDPTRTSFLHNLPFLRTNGAQLGAELHAEEMGRGTSGKEEEEAFMGGVSDAFSGAVEGERREAEKEGGGDKKERKRASRDLRRLLELKYGASLAQPGEPVGVLAAQSIGEPSTQMT